MNLVIIFKDPSVTQFMQGFDMFESFKFLGKTVSATGRLSKPVDETLLELHEKSKDDDYVVVGIIVPGEEAAFLRNHEVMSTGEKWVTVRDLCGSMGVEDFSYVS